MTRPWTLLLTLVLLAAPGGASAQIASAPADRLVALASAEHVDPAWFSASFLAQIPAGRIDQLLAQTRAVTGPFEKISGGGDGVYALRYQKATEIAFIQLDAAGRIELLLLWPPQSLAPPGTPDLARTAATNVFSAARLDGAWFAPSALAAAPLAQLQAAVDGVRAQLGSFMSIEGGDGLYLAHFSKGTVRVAVHLDTGGAIDLLRFTGLHMTAASLDGGLAGLAARPGTVSYVILADGKPLVARAADDPLAVGSAFKLAVLNALQDRVRAGALHWDAAVPLRAEWISLPSGDLRMLPVGTAIPLSTYAAKMISISDNTAADALIALVGERALAPYAARNVPFPTTRAAFVLKANENADLRERWRSTRAPSARAAVLAATAHRPLPPVDEFLGPPRALDVEWFYSVRDLCGLIERAAGLPAMSINPGLADREAFRSVAFKGGSEPGVINLTTRVITKHGATYCISATENDRSALDEGVFELAYAETLRALATR